MRLVLATLAAILPLAGCTPTEHAATQVRAAAQAASTPTLSQVDAAFLDRASSDGITEVTFGQLAREKASRQPVRDFAVRMVDEHTTMNQELTRLATAKGITPTTGLDTAHQNQYDALNRLSGRAFDRPYLNSQATDHAATLQLFQNEAAQGADADVKALAARGAPVILRHLKQIEALGGHPAPPS